MSPWSVPHLNPRWHPWTMLPQGTCWCLWPMLPQRPPSCPWPMLQLRPMMVCRVHAVLEGSVDIYGLYCHQGAYWGSWHILRPEVMWTPMVRTWKFMMHAHINYKGQGSYFCSGIDDCRLTVEKESYRRLLWQPPPPPKNQQPRQEIIRESFLKLW